MNPIIFLLFFFIVCLQLILNTKNTVCTTTISNTIHTTNSNINTTNYTNNLFNDTIRKHTIKISQISSQYGNIEDYIQNFETCEASCVYETNWKNADVVFANVGKSIVKRTFPDQIWVGTFWESLENYKALSYNYNYTLSYSPSANFPNFHMIYDTFKSITDILPMVSFHDKIKMPMVSLWVSNCYSKNNRLGYVRLLQSSGITVSSYGKCMKNKEPLPNRKEVVSSKHLFMFAFENSNCIDYVTEKVFHALKAGTIPIYMGTRSVIRSVPENSIIHVDNFRSHKELATYLHFLSNNKTAYQSYFEWRNKPLPKKLTKKLNLAGSFGTNLWKCNMCKLFHDTSTYHIVPLSHLTCTRRWQNIISFSLYGSDPKYTYGMLSNTLLAKSIYRGWTVRIYHDSTVPIDIIYKLQSLDIELFDMSNSNIPNMQWRFLPMDDPNVKYFIVRDTDSRLSQREKSAVEEWIQSGKNFHSMRDHPFHKLLFMGGCWGAKAGSVPNFREKILKYDHNPTTPPIGSWGKDQNFLNTILIKHIDNNLFNHDAFYCNKFPGISRGFPDKRITEDFVGSLYSHENKRLSGCPMSSQDCKSPLPCRRHVTHIWG